MMMGLPGVTCMTVRGPTTTPSPMEMAASSARRTTRLPDDAVGADGNVADRDSVVGDGGVGIDLWFGVEEIGAVDPGPVEHRPSGGLLDRTEEVPDGGRTESELGGFDARSAETSSLGWGPVVVHSVTDVWL